MFALVRKLLTFHWLATLVLMGVFGLIFGLSSYNLFHLLAANLSFIASHGAMALMEGALEQLFWLIFYGYLAVIAYVLLKACEHRLIACIFADPQPSSGHRASTGLPADAAPAGPGQ